MLKSPLRLPAIAPVSSLGWQLKSKHSSVLGSGRQNVEQSCSRPGWSANVTLVWGVTVSCQPLVSVVLICWAPFVNLWTVLLFRVPCEKQRFGKEKKKYVLLKIMLCLIYIYIFVLLVLLSKGLKFKAHN